MWDVVVASLAAILVGPSPVAQRIANQSLPAHMLVEHMLLIVAGVLGGRGMARLAGIRPPGRATAAAAVEICLVTVGAWHVPAAFDATWNHAPLHAVMDLSYLAVGALLWWSVPSLAGIDRLVAFVVAEGVMTVLALAMATGALAYPPYGPGQTKVTGVAMYMRMQLAVVAAVASGRLARWWRVHRVAPAVSLVLAGGLVASLWWAR
jgi:cytochrome c oxidase assembly factor CtaG